ncbi:MAG TPA: FtsH protease activity modulator HflK [Polyangiales bacterium]|jgi:membrane protease subunit HflK|nr:FtsH protease activity modulator HflK [Polyangiales bacterium]
MANPKRPFGEDPDEFGALRDFGGQFFRGAASQLWRIVIIGIVIVGLWTGYYQVEPEQIGLVTRFGKYLYSTQPGPHFKWPFGIDAVTKVPVQRQLKEEFGFRTSRPGVQTEYEEPEDAKKESRMLTGDLNVADVEWIVQYKIKNPYQYVFRVHNVRATLRDLSEAVMRKVVGDHSVTEVLTVGREHIQLDAKEELNKLCNHYEMGIEILQLVLQDVNPPDAVRESFNEVNQAIQERERSINQAWANYNSVIPEAMGKAEQEIQGAEGYATERVNNALGEVQRFIALQTEYKKSPAVTRSRIYLETIGTVLPNARRRIFIDDDIKGILPLLGMESGAKQ